MACLFVSLNSYPTYPQQRMSLNHSSTHDENTETHLPSPLTPTQASDDHILTVDWDGPDDPENPRKYA